MASASSAREARYAHAFEREREAILGDFDRFDDAFRYAEATLCADPMAEGTMQSARNPDVRIATVRLPGDQGTVFASVFYSFDDSYVDFLSIRRH